MYCVRRKINMVLVILIAFLYFFEQVIAGKTTYPFCHFNMVFENNNHNDMPIKISVKSIGVNGSKNNNFQEKAQLRQGEEVHFNRDGLGGWERYSSPTSGLSRGDSWTEGYGYIFKLENIENENNVSGIYYFKVTCRSYYLPGGCKSRNKAGGCVGKIDRKCTGSTTVGAWTVPGDEFMAVYYSFDREKYSNIRYVIKNRTQIPFLDPQLSSYVQVYENGVNNKECYST